MCAKGWVAGSSSSLKPPLLAARPLVVPLRPLVAAGGTALGSVGVLGAALTRLLIRLFGKILDLHQQMHGNSNMVYTCNGVLFSLADTGYDTEESRKHAK